MGRPRKDSPKPQWYVIRDFSHCVENLPFEKFKKAGFKVFTPLSKLWKRNKRKCVEIPLVRDLFFVRSTREQLDQMVERTPRVVYYFLKGFYHKPMVVGDEEMERFITACKKSDSIEYYTIEQVRPYMRGQIVRIIGGKLDGCEGRIMEVECKGKEGIVKRLLVELPGLFAAGVELKDFECINPI